MPWDFDSSAPIYAQLASLLRSRIASGEYPPGSPLPAVRTLAAEAGVNPNTMQRAFAQLEQQGLLYTRRTAGRFVTEDTALIAEVRRRLAREKLELFLIQMEQLGYSRGEIRSLLTETDKEESK